MLNKISLVIFAITLIIIQCSSTSLDRDEQSASEFVDNGGRTIETSHQGYHQVSTVGQISTSASGENNFPGHSEDEPENRYLLQEELLSTATVPDDLQLEGANEIRDNSRAVLNQMEDILRRLGMKQIPQVTKENISNHELQRVLRHYHESMQEIQEKTSITALFNDDRFFASQFYSYNDNGFRPEQFDVGIPEMTKTVFFQLDIRTTSDFRKETIVNSATLKLYKTYVKPELIISSDFVDRSVRIEICQIVNTTTGYSRRSIASRLVSLDNLGWEEFDVSRAVQDWIRDPSLNYGFEVACDSRYNMDDLIHFVVWNETMLTERSLNDILSMDTENMNESHQVNKWPVLNILTQDKEINGHRFKRQGVENIYRKNPLTHNENCNSSSHSRCCRHPIYVSFNEIGWDTWIIEPSGFQTYYCHGECADEHHVKPNCHILDFGPLVIAHFNEEGAVVVSLFKKAIPITCYCANI